MKKSFIKLGHKPRGVMNKTEAMYAELLEASKAMGEIKHYSFEQWKLNVGIGSWYTPDFAVILKDDTLLFVEVKGGYITDKGMSKFKSACKQFPFIKWKMVQYKGKQWKVIGGN